MGTESKTAHSNSKYQLYSGKRKQYIGIFLISQFLLLKPLDSLLVQFFIPKDSSALLHIQIFLIINIILISVCWFYFELKLKKLTIVNTDEIKQEPRKGFISGSIWGIILHSPFLFLWLVVNEGSSNFATVLMYYTFFGGIILPLVDLLFLLMAIFTQGNGRGFILGFSTVGIVSIVLSLGACSKILSGL